MRLPRALGWCAERRHARAMPPRPIAPSRCPGRGQAIAPWLLELATLLNPPTRLSGRRHRRDRLTTGAVVGAPAAESTAVRIGSQQPFARPLVRRNILKLSPYLHRGGPRRG